MFIGVVVAGPALIRPVARFVGAPLPKLRGTAGKLARENAIRSPRRSSRTAVALTLGVALVGFITIFGASVKASLTKVFGQQLHADYLVSAGSGFAGGGMSPAATARIARLPQVSAVSGLRFSPAATRDPKTGAPQERFVTAIAPDIIERIIDPGKITGRLADVRDGAGVSRRLADALHLGIGSRLVAVCVAGARKS